MKARRQVPRVEGAATPVAQHRPAAWHPQRRRIIDAIAAGQQRGHQGHQLLADMGAPGRSTQIDVLVQQVLETQAVGQPGGQQQARVGDDSALVKGDVERLGRVR